MARRAAIYARYSTDRQDERSIDDQIALCRAAAARERLSVVATYHDSAASGASIHGRSGLAALMAAAREKRFDAVIVEELERLSRDLEELPGIFKRLTFNGIDVIAAHEGKADQLRVGLRSVIGAMYLVDVRRKVQRGMAGVVREGRHPGGRAYGYRPILGRPGVLTIDEAEAEIVRRIFNDYVSGATPRAIAAALNREKVQAPRGRRWNASTINGNNKRAHGILRNEIYNGVIVWNRVRMIKDPDTGKRVSRPNPLEERQRSLVPGLRIVDEATWTAVQRRKDARGHGSLATARSARRPRRLLSGLLRCGCCGGALVTRDTQAGRARMHCGTRKESGTCDNARLVYLDEIEQRVLAGLKRRLQKPKFLAAYLEEYAAERRRLAAIAARQHGRLERRAGEVDRELERAIDAIVKDGVPAGKLRDRIATLEDERARIAAELAAAEPAPTVELHPAALVRYQETIAQLQATLAVAPTSDASEDLALVDQLRALVARVIVTPRERSFDYRNRGPAGGPDRRPQCA